MVLDINQVKQHLNIPTEFKDDDLYLADLITVAEQAVINELCILSLDELGAEIPAPIVHAMLLMIGSLYANREPVSYTQCYTVPFSYKYLLDQYRRY